MRFLFILLFLILGACSSQPKQNGGLLVFASDFGTADGAVSAMHGVSYAISENLQISDLTHQIPPFRIWDAAYRLQQTYPYWPANTVFVVVVDPGVGSERKPIVARLKSGHMFVLPDNGLLTLFHDEVEAVNVIDLNKHLRAGSEQSHTFHGRDLFAVTGAKLASGKITFADVGPKLSTPLVQLPIFSPEMKNGTLHGMIPVLDPNYGNVWTNISKVLIQQNFAGLKNLKITIENSGKKIYSGTLPVSDTFSAVKNGEPLLYYNSLLNLAIALNQADFAKKYKISSGPGWLVKVEKP